MTLQVLSIVVGNIIIETNHELAQELTILCTKNKKRQSERLTECCDLKEGGRVNEMMASK